MEQRRELDGQQSVCRADLRPATGVHFGDGEHAGIHAVRRTLRALQLGRGQPLPRDQQQHRHARGHDVFQSCFQHRLLAGDAGQRHARNRGISLCHEHLGHLRLLQQRHGDWRTDIHRRPQRPGVGPGAGRREQLPPASREYRQRKRVHLCRVGLLEWRQRLAAYF